MFDDSLNIKSNYFNEEDSVFENDNIDIITPKTSQQNLAISSLQINTIDINGVGNSLSTAKNLGAITNTAKYTGWVGETDVIDRSGKI